MGAGQQDLVLESLQIAMEKGHWLCIKNLHLVLDWIPILEKEIDTREKKHNQFRLWITTESHPDFSTRLIEKSMKIKYENPPGLKENMKRTYARFEKEETKVDSIEGGRKSRIFIVIAFMHAIIQERINFIPCGWREPHDFSTGDLYAAEYLIDEFQNEKNYHAIQQLLSKFVYGGRIDDTHDQDILKACINKYIRDEVINGEDELFPGWRNPQKWDSQSHHRAILEIPSIDCPSWLHLPSNIQSTISRVQIDGMLSKIKITQSTSLAHGLTSKSVLSKSLQPILKYWSKLTCDIQAVLQCNGNDLETYTDPIQIVIANETQFGQQLYQVVNTAFLWIEEIMKCGKALDSGSYEETCNILIREHVPPDWQQQWGGPLILSYWLKGLVTRLKTMIKWQDIR